MPDDLHTAGGGTAITPAADDDPPLDHLLARYGLRPVRLADRPTFDGYFATLADPLSDYTFSQIFTWRNSLHIAWTVLSGHLCVFANGSGDLTLLLPPIGTGTGDPDLALRQAVELMDDYNVAAGVPERTRVEYASEELVARLDRGRIDVVPMGTDYVYDTARMIDLAGGDLASKRQAKNRFQRLYAHRVESYDPARHLDGCLALLNGWQAHQDQHRGADPSVNAVKRQKEATATELALRYAAPLGLTGMVVYADDGSPTPTHNLQPATRIKGFTFGEPLGVDQSSILIEKTDLAAKGLAQFIFSDFCRQHWADRPRCNVGDDWGLESLAWTKQSYRPVRLLQKYALTPIRSASMRVDVDLLPHPSAVPAAAAVPGPVEPVATTVIRPADPTDVQAAVAIEAACFSADLSLKKRQLQYLQRRPSAVFLVAEAAGRVIGEGVALVRQHKGATSGRIYSLAVDRRHRGRQVGAKLLAGMIDALGTRGVKNVYLEVDRANAKAVDLYQRSGFATVGTLPDYYGSGRDGLHMIRTLA